ncbi:MAG TPA: arsenic transporter [Steroidobacteraceae bacterium]|nr:arsenic transporter [Steroidobacteraceae bacterium]
MRAADSVATWSIAALAILGVVIRPGALPEAVWAVSGALALVLLSLISPSEALTAILQGTDVYLFLVGMMVLAEVARLEGLFDWLAAYAVRHSRGSSARLFTLVYAVGTVVTVFLSNDATAVVLTPAVYAAVRRARAPPLPCLLVCAFIANAASFVLPISNPANLVVYGAHMPPLSVWLRQFGVASVVSIAVTYMMLRWTQRRQIEGGITSEMTPPALGLGGRVALGGIGATAIVLVSASSLDRPLGLPTFLAGTITAVAILMLTRSRPGPVLKRISWSVLPLVAGLFVLARGVEGTGLLQPLGALLAAQSSMPVIALAAGGVAGVACNLMNNLPLGLLAGALVGGAHLRPEVGGAVLIGVDLGPNLSVTGSLATILWLVALRREGLKVSAWQFLAVGSLVMPAALLGALASFWWSAMR